MVKKMEKKYLYKPIPKSKPQTLALIEKFKTEKELNEITIGKMLGDGSINKTGNLCFSQSVKQKDYIEYCFQLFQSYIRPNRSIRSYMNKRKGKEHEILSFETCAIFKDLLSVFYIYEEGTNKRIKVIPKNIADWLTLRGLAYWIMDDGCNRGNKVVLCTHSFTLEENKLLSSILMKKFSLVCSVEQLKNHNTEGAFWYVIKIHNTKLLWTQVKEFILPSFYYKFGKFADSKSISNSSEVNDNFIESKLSLDFESDINFSEKESYPSKEL